jgi:muramoyltetrapeptide carboxypeptidase
VVSSVPRVGSVPVREQTGARWTTHRPRPLRVAVVAPSGAVDAHRLHRGLVLIRSWGLVPVLGASLQAALARTADDEGGRAPADVVGTAAGRGYLSAPDGERLDDLAWALGSPDVDLVWCARGGYGVTRLLRDIDWRAVEERPVLGFSDVTALLIALHARGRGMAVHAHVLHSLAELDACSQRRHEQLVELLRHPVGRGDDAEGPGLAAPLDWAGSSAVEGDVVGPLLGGNITTLASLCGTPSALRSSGAVVALEDVGESPHRLDRSLVTLRDSGSLDGAVGFAVGSLSRRPHDGTGPGPREHAVLSVLRPLGVPVLTGLPFGHGSRNEPFVMGQPVRLTGGRLVATPL